MHPLLKDNMASTSDMTDTHPADDRPELVCMPCHKLFNMINNTYCLRILDMRTEEKYTESRIRSSTHINSSDIDAIKEEINALVDKQKGVFGIILAVDELVPLELVSLVKRYLTSQHEAALLLESAPKDMRTKNWKRMKFVEAINYTQFYCQYQFCDTLFDDADHPSMPGFNGRSKYFASEIIPDFLFLGDYQNATDKQELRALRISHLIDATGAKLAQSVCEELGILYLPINVWDCETSNIAEHFDVTNAFISAARKENGKSLVHCRAGVSRSASIVAAYMVKHPISDTTTRLADTIAHIITERPIIRPNTSFCSQLIRYEMDQLGSSSLATVKEFINFICSKSKLYSGDHLVEFELERVPIQAIKAAPSNPAWKWENAFPPEADGTTAPPPREKKPFLKRSKLRSVLSSSEKKVSNTTNIK